MKDADNIIDSTFGVRLSCRGQACVIYTFVAICFSNTDYCQNHGT